MGGVRPSRPAAGAGVSALTEWLATLDRFRRRAAELEHRREAAPDEATTARRAADELHALLDDVDNVAEPEWP